MTSWRNWELSAEWSNDGKCPDCGHSLIITELINAGKYEDIHNGICPSCHHQYSVASAHGTLTVNTGAAEQQNRIDALEERVARLEELVEALMKRNTKHAPVAEKNTTPLPEKYAFLLR